VGGEEAAELVRLPADPDGGNLSAAWLPDGRRILLAVGGKAEVVDAQTGQRSPLQLPPVTAFAGLDCK
jgi:hypothetical protein